jgi:hypothetical protein
MTSEPRRAPAIRDGKLKEIALRHCGPSHSPVRDIACQAEQDLGFKIEIQVETEDAVIARAIARYRW